MKQKPISTITSYEQLKIISDPLRIKILSYLIEKPHTGHQLAENLNLSRAKILYHLRELEKYEFIKLVKKIERGGNILKYYQAIAKGFIPDDSLLVFSESEEATRQSYLEVLDRAKSRVITAPSSSFSPESADVEKWNSLSLQQEVSVSKEKFLEFANKYRELINELSCNNETKDKDDKDKYYIMTTAFKIDEFLFSNSEEDK
ncbi:Helix-turn-helix domain-containing protein [Salinibacillus kushneri]|uniref:Helix-turn-helix domain-containing protein n=1 Tax=Salinibacillus kushneri TaxID=237682 RepID=A0A1I0HAK7_9BACI|nr:winged helix-turn-helix domain-containing protein [Salinibacillus kushneri]SET80859.1 Helix-turn-helix domain-containing protein [Salinibacillus kushneri]